MTNIADEENTQILDNQELHDSTLEETSESTNGTDKRHLREIVFEICEDLCSKTEKITRTVVRQQAGRGSDRDISKYINEWKESKSLAVQEPNSQAVVPNQQSTEVHAQPINSGFMPDDDMVNLVRGGAEAATGMLIANAAIATHFYTNPDKLPEDLKQQVKEATANFTQSRLNFNRSIFDPQNLIHQAMEKIG
ncbi:DNA-binding protein [Anabaena cylindrica FACHB-243]|uniref:KfrA N-terminal DNA-binding domain-containing protein n=1 Tax=Anabaena cylindrica (strain ATCC 27899 / PCC 7122) TaxID=272123 RepID=K9ZSJ8_ANACC|nr:MULTISPECIES: DNA-binding protein [Anabaena]AFZ61350.1 hypothetical protein Anacy_6075 [Anabaena cylindrica PCC 7122]AZL96596.1 hypothetical protein [Anabaena sp. CCAP 1446/1C]MBD2416649.1 DNA-binding protein [Anabaena cylindrica FACHB-243]MBY5281112.1 hypothetical protein [Anabaena sp. CCAP 1446/1C]MBY5306738.1 hypothetical protein [Anabaena sp. CCAP 1446/1C]